jgi:hypothetical protein
MCYVEIGLVKFFWVLLNSDGIFLLFRMCIVIKLNYFILGLVVLILLIGHSDSFAQDVVGERWFMCVFYKANSNRIL